MFWGKNKKPKENIVFSHNYHDYMIEMTRKEDEERDKIMMAHGIDREYIKERKNKQCSNIIQRKDISYYCKNCGAPKDYYETCEYCGGVL